MPRIKCISTLNQNYTFTFFNVINYFFLLRDKSFPYRVFIYKVRENFNY